MKIFFASILLLTSLNIFASDHHAAETPASKPWVFSSLPKKHQKEYFSMSKKDKAAYGKIVEAGSIKGGIAASTAYFKKKGIVNTKWNQQSVERDLKKFVNREIKTRGRFEVQDKIQNVLRNLELEKIHTQKILRTPDGTSFICADFKDKNGDKVDVDFFVTPGSDGAVADVKRVKVHKVNGKVRYSYLLEKGVWVEKTLL
ncbi:MAG: hypothetical protein HN509_18055 [Halobacteriovoraceae bacterium]|jgi:hypothetical protein|nr:hypothetical protein [Halobacteriovoraceae bacterium]MBT5093418.1 hypothetical protein [Halobacteriovoraceae bacterium]